MIYSKIKVKCIVTCPLQARCIPCGGVSLLHSAGPSLGISVQTGADLHHLNTLHRCHVDGKMKWRK